MSTLESQHEFLGSKCLQTPFPLTFIYNNKNPFVDFLFEYPPLVHHYHQFELVLRDSVQSRPQDRYSIAITQSTGTGKTKLIYALAYTTWVISILVYPTSNISSPMGLVNTIIQHAYTRASLEEAHAKDVNEKYEIRNKLNVGSYKMMKIFLYCHLQVGWLLCCVVGVG